VLGAASKFMCFNVHDSFAFSDSGRQLQVDA
jgi:hypothetical protein